jgi:hypothetical protein
VDFDLLLVGDGGASASAAELGSRTGALADWVRDQREAGVVREGGHIDGPVLCVHTVNGHHAVVDVPAYAAASVSSWLLIAASDLDDAVTVARSCPEAAFGDVRILPVDPHAALP